MTDYDVLIVGAGAAGLTAAVYACRKQLKTAVIAPEVGGLTNLTNHIENYPGVDAQPGSQLMQKFLENATGFGAVMIADKLLRADKNKDNTFTLKLESGSALTCKALILAFGKVPRKLNVPGEKEFFGRGLTTCTTCDAPLFKKKRVVVIGGGNAAVEGAIELSPIATQVYLIHRKESYKADEISVAKLGVLKNVKQLTPYQTVSINGEKFVKSITVENMNTKKQETILVDGVFSEIGYESKVEAVAHLVKTNVVGEIIIDDRCNTSCPGVFAAGDLTPVPYKQTVIAAGEGAKAALEAHKYLSGSKGGH
ncbi:MAG: FAD-dependent oxidoreductase [Candidatus Woesearchaeota archaeon]|nr:FAD-dependent oxidoreductase [Candidatus Woesearchaeota archaeon]